MISVTSSEMYVFLENYAKFKIYFLLLLEDKQHFKIRFMVITYLTLFLAYFKVIFI